MLEDPKETEILKEIRDSEKRAEDMLEKAKVESDAILDDAQKNSSELLSKKKGEIRKLQEKKLSGSRAKAESLKKEKLEEGKKAVKQLRTKAGKNVGKAVDFVMENFEAAVNTVSEPQNKIFYF